MASCDLATGAVESKGSSSTPSSVSADNVDTDIQKVPCLLCDDVSLSVTTDIYLKHLLVSHKLVVADVKLITDFKSYMEYWKERFKGKELTDFCVGIETNSKQGNTAPKEKYFLLCDALPEDRSLRERLQKTKLIAVLETQQKEREDTQFSKNCLFCKQHFHGNRAQLLDHMNNEHNFNIGLPDNLVFIEDFITLLRSKVDRLLCLYCEKTFKNRTALKDHMRKKQHKKLNPRNCEYDKYYIINYLEFGKNWEDVQSEEEVPEDKDEDWNEWTEEYPGPGALCLFCDERLCEIEQLFTHMKDIHEFDFETLKQHLNLKFYQQVKIVNYIRRQVSRNRCMNCEAEFSGHEAMTSHMTETGHRRTLPPADMWDQPQYYFPTYEDDALLCSLEDQTEDDDNSDNLEGTDFHRDSILRKDAELLRELIEEENCGGVV